MAVRDNELAAEAVGVNTTYYKVLAFTIGAMLA
ncbi:MAG: branched-chain amino acid ABC transporter permease, partial [Pseudomonas sp.]|nr:branched-chain amino acid ABC transporter permease [Pseudomonas sp.]